MKNNLFRMLNFKICKGLILKARCSFTNVLFVFKVRLYRTGENIDTGWNKWMVSTYLLDKSSIKGKRCLSHCVLLDKLLLNLNFLCMVPCEL